MASLNLSIHGPSIKSSHLGVINSPLAASISPTYAQWALFSVQAPLVNAFQDVGGKESVLKVQSTGDGELSDLVEDLNEGRIQFAFVKVKDPNSGLPKCVLIGWCGGGVPERTKGYYTSHMAAVAKVLHGYHVQVTARSDNDVTPEAIIQKVADSSGAKYSTGASSVISAPTPPPIASKPIFTPGPPSGSGRTDPIVTSRTNKDDNVDADGWGRDAPPITRTQLEKVESAYQPTKVNMPELLRQHQPVLPSLSLRPSQSQDDQAKDIIKGGYQPIGKVDIAAIRAQAQKEEDTRPTPVKGAYEPVGKVDIAAIRAKAQPQPGSPQSLSSSTNEKGAPFYSQSSQSQHQERLVPLAKPKVASKFGASSNFTGTKPPTPASLGFSQPVTPSTAPVGAASRTFADQGGKTPAQLWAEKKAKQAGDSAGSRSTTNAPSVPSISGQKSDSEWKSGYTGKSWAPVQTPAYGRSLPEDGSDNPDNPSQDGTTDASLGGVSALRDRFKNSRPITAGTTSRTVQTVEDSEGETSSEHVLGHSLPGLPMRPSPPDPETETGSIGDDQYQESDIRVAVPIARGEEFIVEPSEEPSFPPPVTIEEISKHIPNETNLAAEEEASRVSRGAAKAATETSADSIAPIIPLAASVGKCARILFDYERAEDNEVELVADQLVVDIDMVDEDWWLGTNSTGERGLFPSNYVELIDNGDMTASSPETATIAITEALSQPESKPEPQSHTQPQPSTPNADGPTATALFDYEAAEDNEIGFPDGAKITNLDFPDEDWWYGTYDGKSGLFPANYVQIDS